MCLILLAYRVHPGYELVVAANRDEFYDRPTAPLAFWDDAPEVLAGRDLKDGGTWLGITRNGRFAALTNYRDADRVLPDAPSRGRLVGDFLRGKESARAFLARLMPYADLYNGFNLLLGDTGGELVYFSNRAKRPPQTLLPGFYGLSNHLLDTPWPKLRRGREALRELLVSDTGPTSNGLLRLLEDRTLAPEAELPRTGITLDWEIRLSPIFIVAANYGTRSSTVLLVDKFKRVQLVEKNWDNASQREMRLLWPSAGRILEKGNWF